MGGGSCMSQWGQPWPAQGCWELAWGTPPGGYEDIMSEDQTACVTSSCKNFHWAVDTSQKAGLRRDRVGDRAVTRQWCVREACIVPA